MTNQFIFGAMAGVVIGVFVAIIVMALTLQRVINDFCDGQSKMFNLMQGIFTDRLDMLINHVTDLTEIDRDITKYNHEFRQQILDLVEKDHIQHQSMAEEYGRMTQHCVDMVASIEKVQDDRSTLEDERWEMIKDYILEKSKENSHIDFNNLLKDIEPKEIVRIDKKDLVNLLDRGCMNCKHADEDPMEEPCLSCVITETGTSFTNFEPKEDDNGG